MKDSDEYRTRKLEILQKIDFYEQKRGHFFYVAHEAESNILELQDELEGLELKRHWQTRNFDVQSPNIKK
jgi:hypothetical protein